MTLETIPVSVVIPAFRRPEMVQRAVGSAVSQLPPPAQVLVIDDCSGDETGDLAAAAGAEVITHAHNLGESAARNTGLARARNEWVALLDSDDEWLPGHLATLWGARNGHSLVGSAVRVVGEGPLNGQVYGYAGTAPRLLRNPVDVLLPENKLVTSAVLLRREAVLAVGGFRNELMRAEDLDLWVRMLEHGTALAIPRVTALYHVHGEQLSVRAAPMWAAHRHVIDSYAGRQWHSRRVVRRHEGVVAWDEARAALALAQGRGRARTLLRLLGRLTSPMRAVGATELLIARRRRRRMAAALKDPPAARAPHEGS